MSQFRPTHVLVRPGQRLLVRAGRTRGDGTVPLISERADEGLSLSPWSYERGTGRVFFGDAHAKAARLVALAPGAGTTGGEGAPGSRARRRANGRIRVEYQVPTWVPELICALEKPTGALGAHGKPAASATLALVVAFAAREWGVALPPEAAALLDAP